MAWTATDTGGAELRFDAFAAQRPDGAVPAWTLWAGGNADRPTWAIHLSTHTPAALLQDLTYALAYGESARELPDPGRPQAMPRATGIPAPGQPGVPPAPPATHIR
ncbi:DUF317 domain-containing protein [Streptomyces uncialis]|uniref:DUF317 domain-containing protein n=1 Tax=Streptomyces uncialis TaxID=1048205 RepID=UPI00381188E9